MDGSYEDVPHYAYDININFTEQRKILERLNNKYNVNSEKPPGRSDPPRNTKGTSHTNFGSNNSDNNSSNNSQCDSLPNTKGISRTNSSNSNASTNGQGDPQLKTKGISRTNSASSNASSNSQKKIQSTKAQRKEKKPAKTASKNKFESVRTVIDLGFLKTYGEEILNQLDVLEIQYELKTQTYPNLITWNYVNDEPDLDNDTEFETVLLILNWKEVIEYVSSSSLIQHVKSMLDVLKEKRITLGLYGFENYFKYWKSRKQERSNDKFSDYQNSIKISRYELEYVLTELEVRYSCSHRFLENVQDIVDIVSQFTKSIAQLPEKLEKKEKYKNLDFCLVKDNRDCVLVDKNGNGFRRLWQQQLTMFDMVRLETAEAILSKYSTPTQLLEAYASCSSKAEGVKLLEDIPIRRAVGPLTTARRVGPELSNKMYNFFNAVDGNAII